MEDLNLKMEKNAFAYLLQSKKYNYIKFAIENNPSICAEILTEINIDFSNFKNNSNKLESV